MATIKETSEIIKHKFQDGTEVSGTFEQLQKISAALGLKLIGVKVRATPRGYYMSETKGLIKISDMNDYHIRRALLKRSREYFAEVYDKDDTNKMFLKKFTDLVNDTVIIDLYNELARR